MPEHSIDSPGDPSSGPAAWAELIDVQRLEQSGAGPWREEDLAAILRHQMTANVQFDLEALDSASISKLRESQETAHLATRSFAELLDHVNPPVELLELTRRFAKSAMIDPNGPLPKEVASILYYASILVALTRCNRRITRLDDEALSRGVRSVLEWEWLDEPTRALLQQGLDHISGDKRHA